MMQLETESNAKTRSRKVAVKIRKLVNYKVFASQRLGAFALMPFQNPMLEISFFSVMML